MITKTAYRYAFALLICGAFLNCTKEIKLYPGSPASGSITVLDNGGLHGDTGWWPSLALDTKEQPHLSYCDAYRGNLHYAKKVDGAWKTEAIISDGKVGKYTALGVAADGTIGISFYDQGQVHLRYTYKKPGGTWQHENVAWGLEVGMASELRFDDNNQAHLFYYLPSGKLVHALRNQQGLWSKQIIYEATGGFTVRIDPHLRDDGIWVSFVDWGFKDLTLMLGRTDSSGQSPFNVETIFEREGPGWRSQLVFPSAKADPYLLYSLNFTRTLQLAEKTKDGWKTSVLLPSAGNFVAKATPKNNIIVVAESLENPKLVGGTLHLIRKDNGKWTKQALDKAGPNGSQLSMAVTKGGKAIVAYYSKEIKGIKIYDETSPIHP